jgi:hypothetical protein
MNIMNNMREPTPGRTQVDDHSGIIRDGTRGNNPDQFSGVMGNTREEPRQRPHIGRNRDEPVGRPHRSYVDMSLGYQPSQSTQHSGQTLDEPHETMREDDQVKAFESSRDDVSGLSDLEDLGEGNFSPYPSDDDDLSGVYSDSFGRARAQEERGPVRASIPTRRPHSHQFCLRQR